MSARYLGGVIAQTQLPLNPAAGNAANGVFTMSQYMQAVKNATWPGFDPYFKQTTLLLHGNGTNGAQNNTFLDSSTNNFTITRNGNTTQGTFSPFSLAAGEWSNYFDGSGDELSIANNSAFDPGTGNFTVEAWVNVQQITNANFLVIRYQAFTGGRVFYLATNAGGFPTFALYNYATQNSASGFKEAASPTALTIGTWNHLAGVRSGDNLYIFVNGELKATTTGASSFDAYGTSPVQIGAYNYPGFTSFANAYISNARIVKGTAVYTSNFTPSTTPLTAITNTSLLTCQSNRFVDNSTNAFAITPNGDVKVTPFSPFAPTAAYSADTNGGSGYFDGTGDYLTAGAASDWTFLHNGSDWTCEFWLYHSSTAFTAIVSTTAFSAQIGMSILVNTTYAGGVVNGVQVYIVDGGGTVADEAVFNSTGLLSINQWNYVAITFTSSTKTCAFTINGASAGSTSNAGFTYSASNPTNTLAIGRYQGSTPAGYLTGYIGSLRISTNVRTGLTSVPTAPYTSDANTKLLCNFTNAGIIDNTGKNVLETVGNAQIDTTTKKYGTGSMEFDGTGDYLIMKNTPEMAFGSGDFTIEFWLNTSDLGAAADKALIDFRPSGTNGAYPYLYIYQSKIRYWFQNADRIVQASTLSTGTWYHVALTRSGSGTKLFVNGTQEDSTYTNSDTLLVGTNRPVIGANSALGANFNGYIDDLRITKGVARYTSNFAVPYLPQGPLPLVGGPYIPNTVLMLPGTGTNGAQNNTFLDSSTNNFTITRNGNTTQGTFSPFSRANGYWGNYFDGSGDFLQLADSTAWDLTGDYTIEMWLYKATGTSQTFFQLGTSSNILLYQNASNEIIFYSGSAIITASTAASLNTWNHVALVRNGGGTNNTVLYLNGVNVGQATNTTSFTGDASNGVRIGAEYPTGFAFNGYISNVRVIKGTAVYTSNFTPTGPLTAIANTSLLTCQSNRFVDNSTNNFTITRNGDVKVVTFSPFEYLTAYSPATNGGSGYFDGSGDYLSIANNAAFNIGTNDFTIEAMIYLDDVASLRFISALYLVFFGTDDQHQFFVWNDAGTYKVTLTLVSGSSEVNLDFNIGTTDPSRQWHHVAVSRASGSVRCFWNGTQIGTTQTYTSSINQGTNALLIGTRGNTDFWFKGYISNYRYVNGTALYTANFTPPTTPLTAVTNTQVLLSYTNAGIYDASMSNDLETVGNAQVSTTQSKWGGGSMYFDGTGDYLIMKDTPEMAFGSGDFTIEMWLYRSASNVQHDIIAFNPTSTNGAYPALYISSGNALSYYTDGANRITGGTINTGQWYHIALTRSGTSTKLFIDGTQSGSTFTDTYVYLCGANRPVIGSAGFNISGSFNGYISDLRILKGVAILPTPLQTSQWQDQ